MERYGKAVAWVVGVVAIIVLLYYIWTPFWHLIGLILSSIISFIGDAAVGIWKILIAAILMSISSIVQALSIAISVLFSLALAFLVLLAALFGFGLLLAKLAGVSADIKSLGDKISADTRQSAKDALFLGILALMLALIAYAVTDDFIEKFSTMKLLATIAFTLCIAKLFIMYPSRVSKIGGIALGVIVILGTATFLDLRYQLMSDAQNGFPNLLVLLFPPDEAERHKQMVKLSIIAVILTLSVLTILYPFGWAEWKRMLRWRNADA